MSRNEYVTNTGWRVVGAIPPINTVPELVAGRDEDVLFTVKVAVRNRLGTGSPILPILTALHEVIRVHWADAPPLTQARTVERPSQRFHGLKWEPVGTPDAWSGTLLWRRPHPETAGAPCTTHIHIRFQNGSCTLAIRVTADNGLSSVRGVIGAGLARPNFLVNLLERFRLTFDGRECQPHTLAQPDMAAFVGDILLGDNRQTPIAVLSPLAEGGYAIDPFELSTELVGLAHLFVLDNQRTSYELSDELGDRRLSCYWGALRVYMPEFSCADRPDQHPLLQRDRLTDPLMRAQLIGNLSRIAQRWVTDFNRNEPAVARAASADRSVQPREASLAAPSVAPIRPPSIRPDVTPLGTSATVSVGEVPQPVPRSPFIDRQVAEPQITSTVADPVTSQRPSIERAPVSVLPPSAIDVALQNTLSRLDERLDQMTSAILALAEANARMVDELSRMRSTNLARSSGSNTVDKRLHSIETAIGKLAAPLRTNELLDAQPDASGSDQFEDERVSLVDVVRQASTAHPETLFFLDNAEATAAESPYEDHERLAAVFDVMANVAERRRSGSIGGSLREVLRESGVEYRGGIAPSTSERMRQQYAALGPDGKAYDCHEHIVLGSGYDPRYCLRIYFTSKATLDPRFIIGHVGRHLEVKSTT